LGDRLARRPVIDLPKDFGAFGKPTVAIANKSLRRPVSRSPLHQDEWRPESLTPLLNAEPTAGLSDSVHHVCLTDGAERIGPPGDAYESSRIEWMSLEDVPTAIGRGEISSGATVVALLYAITLRSSGI
jgi:hypothetical protein